MARILIAILIIVPLSYLALSKMQKESTPTVYYLPKERTLEKAAIASSSPPKIEWVAPQEWEERPASGMRYASFAVGSAQSTAEGVEADISIVFIPGNCGSDLANINRWREQIHLGRWTAEEMERNSSFTKTQIGGARTVKLISDPNHPSEEGFSAIYGAILPVENGTWFVKLSADRETLEQQEQQFTQFLLNLSCQHE